MSGPSGEPRSNFDLPNIATTFRGLALLAVLAGVLQGGGWMFQVLKPRPGTIVVQTTPAGATILVDGRAKGSSPITIQGLSSGSHTVQAVLPGYRAVMRRVDVLPSYKEKLEWQLQPALPLLRYQELASVRALPEWRKVQEGS
jgi:hypothetical protein